MQRGVLIALLIVAAALGRQIIAQSAVGPKSSIINTKHDFRAASPAAIKATTGQNACVFCHTPHNASPSASYLWNKSLSPRDFPAYFSSTMQATPGVIQPRDVSKLCLSCHDGTIALGDTVNDGSIPFVGASTLPASSLSNLAGDQTFTNDHPFGFTPQMGSEMATPPVGDAVHLDSSGKVQCTSCHDPHVENIDTTTGKFLVKPNASSNLCLTCHQKAGWTGSAHRMPPDAVEDGKYTGSQGAHTGYIGVSRNGCESCHRPHAPQVSERLVKFPEENTCFQCHDGSVTNRNIKADFLAKTYKHPVLITPSAHDASENPNSAAHPLPETASGMARHAECADCHNPHYANNSAAQPPLASGALLGVKGQSDGNSYLRTAINEYEICFKCHADSANKPQNLDVGTAGIGYGRNPQRQFNARDFNAYNTRSEFTMSVSFHPVTRARNISLAEVPSLRTSMATPAGSAMSPARPLSSGSLIYCSDCHNSDTGRNLSDGSAGAAGPHGSNIPHLLERQNAMEPPPAIAGTSSSGSAFASSNYALCDKCHNVQQSILQDVSFKRHKEHVVDRNAACATCHDAHSSQGPMLVNFDRSIVDKSSNGLMQYTRTGPGHGTCTLMCHGKDHNAFSY